MNISSAKEQIKNAVRIYLQKDAMGNYQIPLVHQRPVFLQGPPGLGKTAIMEQISREMGIGLVAYSMTHHTRQSAVGLPMIVQKEFGGETYSVSEYTMSEIIASVYECMERTGKREGILFLDEINCISETLSPTMLLFLQYKIFGGHKLPEGWVVVTAGNPPRFNKSVRDFDAATRDRLKYLSVEPDFDDWKEYALKKNVCRTVISFLTIRPERFYVLETTVEGFRVVTPRSWEDLSQSILMHEKLGLEVDQNLISQYIQNEEVARDFSIYYELYRKYRLAYNVDEILAGHYTEETVEEAKKARPDERLTLTGLLLEAVQQSMQKCNVLKSGMKEVREQLVLFKAELEQSGISQVKIFADMREAFITKANDVDEDIRSALLCSMEIINEIESGAGEVSEGNAFEICRSLYGKKLSDLEQMVHDTQQKCGNLLKFLREAFGEGNELGMAVSDLTSVPEATTFIGQFLSLDFFRESSALQLHKKEDQLLQKINLTLG